MLFFALFAALRETDLSSYVLRLFSYLPELRRDIYNEIVDKSQVIFESVERIQKYLSRIGIST